MSSSLDASNSITLNFGWKTNQFTQNGDVVSAGMLLLLFEITPKLQDLFSIWVFRFLGKISYALYLTHCIVLFAVVPRWLLYIQPEDLSATARSK